MKEKIAFMAILHQHLCYKPYRTAESATLGQSKILDNKKKRIQNNRDNYCLYFNTKDPQTTSLYFINTDERT